MPRPGGGDDWIEREIRDFTSGPNGSRIIAVRGVGEFDAPLPADLRRSFPNIEIVDLRGASRFWFLSFSRMVRLSAEKLKLVAPLLGIPPEEMPKLRQEEEKREQTRFGAIAGATFGILVAVTSLSVYALISRHQAVRANDDSMFASGSMIEEAANLDARDTDAARTRRLILGRGCDLLDNSDQGAASDPPVKGIVICRLERAGQRESLQEDREARKEFDEAIKLASLNHERRGRIDAALALLQARQAYAEYLLRKKDAVGSETEYTGLRDDAQRLGKQHDRPGQFAQFEGEALGKIGDSEVARGDREGAAGSYDGAAAAAKQWLDAVISELRTPDSQTVAWVVRLYGLAALQYGELNKFDTAIDRFNLGLAARSLDKTKQATVPIELETAVIYAGMFRVERRRGNADAAAAAKQNSLRSIELVANSEDSTPDLKQRADGLKRWIEREG
jgi:hypothetical protein